MTCVENCLPCLDVSFRFCFPDRRSWPLQCCFQFSLSSPCRLAGRCSKMLLPLCPRLIRLPIPLVLPKTPRGSAYQQYLHSLLLPVKGSHLGSSTLPAVPEQSRRRCFLLVSCHTSVEVSHIWQLFLIYSVLWFANVIFSVYSVSCFILFESILDWQRIEKYAYFATVKTTILLMIFYVFSLHDLDQSFSK